MSDSASSRPRASAESVLAPLFKNNFNFDISKITFKFGFTGTGAAITITNTVTLDQDSWNKLDPEGQRQVLAHEITHSVQYEHLNFARGGILRGIGLPMATMSFLGRYVPTYIVKSYKENYDVPGDLKAIPLSKLDVLDTDYTLDQIAERVAHEIK